MSKATLKNVASVLLDDGREIEFDRSEPPSIWGAAGAKRKAEKAKREGGNDPA